MGRQPPVLIWDPTLPFKANAACRNHIQKQKRKLINWAAYDASLRQRGSLTVWFHRRGYHTWRAARRTTRGGQAWYSPPAILTALMLRAVFHLALRRTEGLIGSIIGLLGLTWLFPTTPLSAGGQRRWTCRSRDPAAALAPNLCTCWSIAPGKALRRG
jgi:hypothetical protein